MSSNKLIILYSLYPILYQYVYHDSCLCTRCSPCMLSTFLLPVLIFVPIRLCVVVGVYGTIQNQILEVCFSVTSIISILVSVFLFLHLLSGLLASTYMICCSLIQVTKLSFHNTWVTRLSTPYCQVVVTCTMILYETTWIIVLHPMYLMVRVCHILVGLFLFCLYFILPLSTYLMLFLLQYFTGMFLATKAISNNWQQQYPICVVASLDVGGTRNDFGGCKWDEVAYDNPSYYVINCSVYMMTCILLMMYCLLINVYLRENKGEITGSVRKLSTISRTSDLIIFVAKYFLRLLVNFGIYTQRS